MSIEMITLLFFGSLLFFLVLGLPLVVLKPLRRLLDRVQQIAEGDGDLRARLAVDFLFGFGLRRAIGSVARDAPGRSGRIARAGAAQQLRRLAQQHRAGMGRGAAKGDQHHCRQRQQQRRRHQRDDASQDRRVDPLQGRAHAGRTSAVNI